MEEKRNFSCNIHGRTEQLKANFGLRSSNRNYFHDPGSWGELQELQKLYKKLLLSDIDYALEKKVEVDLWNFCFKDYITYLQLQVKSVRAGVGSNTEGNHKNIFQNTIHGGVRRTAEMGGVDPNVTLQWFLEMASGYFILLLEEMSATFDLHLPFLKRGISSNSKNKEVTVKTNASEFKEKLNYICQYCLVHLGDISRYQNQLRQAEIFYRQAIQISPTSGQAYNQIALLHANTENKLSSIYYYIRSIALKQPFPAASSNLSKMFASISSNSRPSTEASKVSINKSNFLPEFLRFHALLHEARNLQTAYELSNILNEAITSLIATNSLTTLQLIQMVVISIFQINRFSASVEEESSVSIDMPNTAEMLSNEERIIRKLIVESIAGMLNAFLLPVYTLMQGKSLLNYFALPATKILLDWISSNPKILEEPGFLRRLQIWPSLCRVLNELSTSLEERNDLNNCGNFNSDLKHYPLPEDYDLQAFLPLEKRLALYRFAKVLRQKPISKERVLVLRATRILELGKTFADAQVMEGQTVLKVVTTNAGEANKMEKFEAVEQVVPKDVSDILTDLEKLNFNKGFSDNPESDDLGDDENMKEKYAPKDEGKETGRSILKNHLALQLPDPTSQFYKPAYTTQQATSDKHTATKRGPRTNVAMAAIMRQAAAAAEMDTLGPNKESTATTSNKQVKFSAPSPVLSSSPDDLPHSQQSNISQDGLRLTESKSAESAGRLLLQNEARAMHFGQKSLSVKNSISSLIHPIDFSVPPPSIPSSKGIIAIGSSNLPTGREVSGDTIAPNYIKSNIRHAFSDSIIPKGSGEMYQPQRPSHIEPHQQPSSAINLTFPRPSLHGGHLPFPSQQQEQPSPMWPTSQRLFTNTSIHSQSDNSEQFRYQLPQFGGLNKLQQTISKQEMPTQSPSGIDPHHLQFQHPYPTNEVHPEIKTTSSNTCNKSSPIFHRLFSMDPTWSVTPGSLPPTNPDGGNIIAQSNFNSRPIMNASIIPNTSDAFLETEQRQHLSEREKHSKTNNEHILF